MQSPNRKTPSSETRRIHNVPKGTIEFHTKQPPSLEPDPKENLQSQTNKTEYPKNQTKQKKLMAFLQLLQKPTISHQKNWVTIIPKTTQPKMKQQIKKKKEKIKYKLQKGDIDQL